MRLVILVVTRLFLYNTEGLIIRLRRYKFTLTSNAVFDTLVWLRNHNLVALVSERSIKRRSVQRCAVLLQL